MDRRLAGIHHITAIARDGAECIRFYCDVLGQRLVKVTVNYDDPSRYHIYFGDHRGSLGTLLTFFLWPAAPRGLAGRGQVEGIAYAVPKCAFTFWQDRLREFDVGYEVEDTLIRLRDPDGTRVDLVQSDARWFDGVDPARGVPADCALGTFRRATLAESNIQRSASFLEETMGLERLEQSEEHVRLRLGDGGELDLVKRDDADALTSAIGPGIVHHIAFRTADDGEQIKWRVRVQEQGVRVTSVRERTYFRSIYFREPGGVLFEIATEQPGLAADEPLESLGGRLVLPAWLEERRSEIERSLPELPVPLRSAPG